jgi:hypothetical protein
MSSAVEASDAPVPVARQQSRTKMRRKKSAAKLELSVEEDDLSPVVTVPALPAIPTFRQGDRCVVGENHGFVQFAGHIPSLGPGMWVGVQYDEPVGFSNGRLHVKPHARIFECPNNHGAFLRPSEVVFERGADQAAEQAAPVAAVKEPQGTAPTGGVRQPSKKKLLRKETINLAAAASEAGGQSREDSGSALAAASKCEASGRGLHTAVVKQLAQFVITARDADGKRRTSGGDAFAVAVRGVRPNPQQIRA